MTIINNNENILQLMTTALFVKAKKRTINFRNLFDTAIGLRVLENGVLRLTDFKIFWERVAMPPDPLES